MKHLHECMDTMTVEEFLKYVNDNELCPSCYDLNDTPNCELGDDLEQCNKCWKQAIEGLAFKSNKPSLFETRGLDLLKALRESEEQYKTIKEQRDNLKEELLKSMEEYGVKKWENEQFSITYVTEGIKSSVDNKKLLDDHPDVYSKVVKNSTVKPSIRFKVKQS